MVQNFTDKDFDAPIRCWTLRDACGTVDLNSANSTLKNPMQPVQVTGSNWIYFKGVNDTDITPFWRAIKIDDNNYQLYELSYEAYCKYGF